MIALARFRKLLILFAHFGGLAKAQRRQFSAPKIETTQTSNAISDAPSDCVACCRDRTCNFSAFKVSSGRRCLQGNPQIAHLGDAIETFGNTAAIIAELDLAISSDTSVVHLAGGVALTPRQRPYRHGRNQRECGLRLGGTKSRPEVPNG
jgi:hypothetical protein